MKVPCKNESSGADRQGHRSGIGIILPLMHFVQTKGVSTYIICTNTYINITDRDKELSGSLTILMVHLYFLSIPNLWRICD